MLREKFLSAWILSPRFNFEDGCLILLCSGNCQCSQATMKLNTASSNCTLSSDTQDMFLIGTLLGVRRVLEINDEAGGRKRHHLWVTAVK